MSERPRVAVTGAGGRIGRAFAHHLASRGYELTLVDQPGRAVEGLAELGRAVELDLSADPPRGLFAGADVVVHLAGEARPDAPWERLLRANVEASYNVAVAALRAGCHRLIVASSVHAVAATPHRPIPPDGAVAPSDVYGVTKCFVEALAFWCSQQGSMSAAAVRIGAFQTVEASHASDAGWMADVFIAVPDLLSLLERALVADYRFAILHAAAPGHGALLDTRATEALLGWRARHRFPPASGVRE